VNDGTEPDYRFTLANERTFLAWVRTALALLAGALVIHQFIRFEPRWVLVSATCTLAVLAAVLSAGAYLHWRATQRAMRHAGPLPRTPLIPLLATVTAVLSALAVLIIVLPK